MEWDEEKHLLLNAHFRQRINELLQTEPFLKKAVSSGKSIELPDLVNRMTEKDQRLWQEFMRLDRVKLHLDMNDHLEGRGTPYSARTGFGNPSDTQNGTGAPW